MVIGRKFCAGQFAVDLCDGGFYGAGKWILKFDIRSWYESALVVFRAQRDIYVYFTLHNILLAS